MTKITIIDTGCANLSSVKFAFDRLGYRAEITRDIHKIQSADKLLLPGVGTAVAAMRNLQERKLIDCIRNATQPMLGICLGMQLMTEFSTEGNVATLGLMSGQTDLIPDSGLPLPHMGWNKLVYNHDCPLFDGLGNDEYVYFVHSYKAFCDNKNLYAYCEYVSKVPAVVSDGRYIFGCQFHPEKSGKTGLKILENFAKLSQEVK